MQLRQVTPDIAEVPEVGRAWRIAGGLAMVLFGAGLLCGAVLTRAPTAVWTMGIVGAVFLIGGLSIAAAVRRVLVDRANGLIIKRHGKFRANSERSLRVSPRAIRLTIDRETMDESSIRDMPVNKLFIVHEKGQTLVASCRFSLGRLRELAGDLAQFLGVEQYEDRLFPILGAFTHQTGPGTQPTRTYLNRQTITDVPPADREDSFLDREEFRDLAEEEAWTGTNHDPHGR